MWGRRQERQKNHLSGLGSIGNKPQLGREAQRLAGETASAREVRTVEAKKNAKTKHSKAVGAKRELKSEKPICASSQIGGARAGVGGRMGMRRGGLFSKIKSSPETTRTSGVVEGRFWGA